MRPDGAGLPISHQENAHVEAQEVEGEVLAVRLGVETDPGAALNSIGDEKGLTFHGIVRDVMKAHHGNGVGAGFSTLGVAEDQVLALEVGGLGDGDEGRVV